MTDRATVGAGASAPRATARSRPWVVALLAAVLGPGAVRAGTAVVLGPAEDPFAEVRGMTVSCHEMGREWGRDEMVAALEELRGMGVNWIAIHPYAGITAGGEVEAWPELYREVTWLTRPIQEAHRLDMKVAIKPHLAYWGGPFAWRGAIRFETEEQWVRFFATYGAWIEGVAEICGEADALVVGTELDATVHREDDWRGLIRSLRARSSVPLTYAANWDSYESVPFWDALDVIGVQAYFPLVDHPGTPTQDELDRAWDGLATSLARFARAHRRRIVLSELGYDRSSVAALRPWQPADRDRDDGSTQARCLRAALGAIDATPEIVGAFLWKWFVDRPGRGSFRMDDPDMRRVISGAWSWTRGPDCPGPGPSSGPPPAPSPRRRIAPGLRR